MDSAIDVCAAVIVRDGRYLLARRLPDSHLAGCWEFPGGKQREGENRQDCIRRELKEELGLDASPSRALTTICHTYPEKTVRLHFVPCTLTPEAEPVGLDGQQVGWFPLEGLQHLDLAPADRRFVEWLGTE